MHLIAEKSGFRAPGFFEFYWKQWSLAFEIIYSGSDGDRWPWMIHAHFLLVSMFLRFPWAYVPPSKKEWPEWQRWGFSHCDDAVHFHWGEHIKIWNLPWVSKIHQRYEVRRADGSWVPFVGSWEQDKQPDGREEFIFPYQYVLRSGQVQERQATVYVERMAWRPKWFEWTPLFEESRQSISVEFDGEVGERSGSWKGGRIGCAYEMRPLETPEQTLRRMERERASTKSAVHE